MPFVSVSFEKFASSFEYFERINMKRQFTVAKRLCLFSFIIFMQIYTESAWNLRPKDLKIENVKQCLDFVSSDSPIVIDVFDITQRERQKWSLNSTIRILNDIPNNIYFKMNVTKCSFSRFKCEDLETIATPNVCDKINSANTLWAPVVKMVQPQLRCPIKAGVYHVEDSTFDLGIVSRVPIDPGKILVNLTFFDYPVEKRARLLICLMVEVTITQSKQARNRTIF